MQKYDRSRRRSPDMNGLKGKKREQMLLPAHLYLVLSPAVNHSGTRPDLVMTISEITRKIRHFPVQSTDPSEPCRPDASHGSSVSSGHKTRPDFVGA